ncbi:hypothetical protein [Pararcticibacter amylolyticus]|uniref:Uncharacterized protein n=1 Tax=Pararcticibacter amylolyticus TaxID=2173175 RepID=A0A2U2PHE9_9SPHI|nr:hypothetical protein [Pararcticibacter amylolyticus]PWG80811.1 hypothetical protein DDR33_10160 [Pararcticibacter amylolyticus]
MLFNNFSWQEFLLAAAVLSLVWYAGVWLLFYRKKTPATDVPLPHGWQDEVDVLENVPKDDLMGKRALERGVSVVDAGDFSFGLPEQSRLGVLPDVQEEIKSACREIERDLGGKEEFYALFRSIRDRYPIPEASRELLNDFIREHVPFFLSEEELESLWL